MLLISQHCADYMAPSLQFLEDNIKYYEETDMLHTNSIAGNTDFDLKTPVDYSFDKSDSLKRLKDGFDKCLDLIETDEEREKAKDYFKNHIIKSLSND